MLDYSEKRETGFDLIPEGTYEATAKCLGITTKTRDDGSTFSFISLSWRIRDDIEQACPARVVFDDIHQDKNNPSQYNDRKIYDIIFGGQDQNDSKSRFKFEDYDDLCQHLNGMNCRIDVEINEYNGVKRNRIKFGGYHPSQARAQVLGAPASPVVASGGLEDLDDIDSDVPF